MTELSTQTAKYGLRTDERRKTNCVVEITWRTENGEKHFESCRAIDISENGVAVECPEAIPLSSNVIVWAPAFQIAALAQVRHCTWHRSTYALGLRFLARTGLGYDDPAAPDHYEILRLSHEADPDSIERVYKMLAKRFHPENLETGDAETFLRVSAAYRILSDPARRARYGAERDAARQNPRFELHSRDFFVGIQGEQNRRLAVLCLLYRKHTSNYEHPQYSLIELERLTACTREELGFALWYLCERGYTRRTDSAEYTLTADGVDYVERQLKDDQSELRAIAAAHDLSQRPRSHPQFALPPAGEAIEVQGEVQS